MPQDAPATGADPCLQALPMLEVASSAAASGPAADPEIRRELGHGLQASYRVNLDGQPVRLRRSHLAAAGLDEDALHELALGNLATRAESGLEVHPYGHIHVVLLGDQLEASIALMEEFWEDWVPQLAPNGFMAAFPARDILAFCDGASVEGARELQDLCTRVDPAIDEPLTDTLHARSGGTWRPVRIVG